MLSFKEYMNESVEDFKDFEKLQFDSVNIEKEGIKKFIIAKKDDDTFKITPYYITVYKKKDRLRLPAKTRYEVYIDILVNPGQRYQLIRKSFGKAVGETINSGEKIAAGIVKAIAWVKKLLGLTITRHDFH